jgi:hypothetical protein
MNQRKPDGLKMSPFIPYSKEIKVPRILILILVRNRWKNPKEEFS